MQNSSFLNQNIVICLCLIKTAFFEKKTEISVVFAYGRSADSEDVLFTILVEKWSMHSEDEMNYSRYKIV